MRAMLGSDGGGAAGQCASAEPHALGREVGCDRGRAAGSGAAPASRHQATNAAQSLA